MCGSSGSKKKWMWSKKKLERRYMSQLKSLIFFFFLIPCWPNKTHPWKIFSCWPFICSLSESNTAQSLQMISKPKLFSLPRIIWYSFTPPFIHWFYQSVALFSIFGLHTMLDSGDTETLEWNKTQFLFLIERISYLYMGIISERP